MKFPNVHRGVRILLFSEALTLCAFLLRFPILAGIDPQGWGNRTVALQRYVVPALLLAGAALQLICIVVAGREAPLFRVARWLACLKLLFIAAWCAVGCGWPPAGNNAADLLATCAAMCQLFIYYDILGGVQYFACELADLHTLSTIEGIRKVLFATCGAMTLTRMMRLFVQDGRGVLALGIVCLVLRAASGTMFIFVLYRVLRLEKEGQGGEERRR